MYPLNDKDLDRLSREAAEHYDVESSASGWERLENRLDKELPVKEKDRKRFLFWLLLIALLSGGSLVYMLGGSPGDDRLQAANAGQVAKGLEKNTQKTSSENPEATTAEKSSLQKSEPAVPDYDVQLQANDKTATTGSTNKNSTDIPATGEPAPAVTKTNASTAGILKVDAKKSGNLSKGSRGRDQPGITAGNKRIPGRKQPIIPGNLSQSKNKKDKPVNPPTDTDKAPGNATIHNNNNITDVAKTQEPAIVASAAVDSIQKIAGAKDTAAIVVTPAEEISAKEKPVKKPAVKKAAPPPSKWEFGITTGPDFSNVGFKHSYKTGWNIGATVGYRLSNRWLINTGLLYTKKFYKVDGADFYPPKHTLISYLDIDHLTGSCSMFEIPINVRYDISYNQESRFFASTGISSYIMDKQDYECNYWSQTGEYRKYPWRTDSNYNHLFSNINLSIGYERALGKNFSIQAEPYFKLPLQGFGYGDIKMNSYGMLLTFKYKPGVKSKK